MSEKLTHDEFCARGGRSRSALKMEAARNNLEKAKAALAAAFVGGRALARSFCSFRRAAPAFLLCIANPLVVRAEQLFERAEVTKTINAVSVLPRNTKAVPGDVITKDLALKTGGDSRAELEFPDLTITRVGSNALFRFLAGKREIILDGGTMLFSCAERRRRRQSSGWGDHCCGDGHGLPDFEYQQTRQGNLSQREGSRLFHGESQGRQGA